MDQQDAAIAVRAPPQELTDRAQGHIRVLIAEDDQAVRESLADLIGSERRLELVGAAADAGEAIALSEQCSPDVVLLDVRMPGGGGMRAAREILAASPRTKVIALSAYDDRATVVEMLGAGASGYLVKGTEPEEIVATICRSVQGASALSSQVAAGVIDEVRSLLDNSERLARELREFREQRNELVQNLSHELFTPTAVIQGSGQLIAKHGEKLSTDELEELTAGVAKATQRLRRMVDNVAVASELDDSGQERPQPVAVAHIIEQAIAVCPVVDRDRVISSSDLRSISVWSTDLGPRALAALLENALSLAPDQPVEVEVRKDGVEVRIAVLDRGPGVPEEVAERIFEPFVQADGGLTREHEGLGIGLYMARRIMRASDGQVEFKPRDGGGSVFSLVFKTAREGQA